MGTQAHDLFVIPLCRALHAETMAPAEICCEKSHVRYLINDFSDKMLAKFKKMGGFFLTSLYGLLTGTNYSVFFGAFAGAAFYVATAADLTLPRRTAYFVVSYFAGVYGSGLVGYESDVFKLVKVKVKVKVTQGQFDALVSFTYKLGARALSTSTLLKKLNDGGSPVLLMSSRAGIRLVEKCFPA